MKNQSPVSSIIRRWWLVLAMALAGGAIGAIPRPAQVEEQATTFTATHTLLVNTTDDATVISPSQLTLLATTGDVPSRAADQIGFDGNAAELAADIEVLFDFETGALTISTEQETAVEAEQIANALAIQLTTYLTERQDLIYQERLNAARARVEDLQDELNDLIGRLALAPTDAVLLAERDAISREYGLAFEQDRLLEEGSNRLTLTSLESAQAVPEVDRGLGAPASRPVRGVMGLIVGAVLGALAAVILGRLDNTIRSAEDAEASAGMRAQVRIPRTSNAERGIVVNGARQDPLSDAYRTVRNVVSFIETRSPSSAKARIILVVSPGPGDGKTSLAANLAAAFVETGQRTIVVNTDFRRPRLREAILGSPGAPSPIDIQELDDIPRRALPLDTGPDDLKILDLSNMRGSAGDLARATMRQVGRLADGTDQIVIDTSPVDATAEVLDLVPFADVIVIVTRVGNTSIEATERSVAILRDIATAPLLLVVGGIKFKRNQYYDDSDRRTRITATVEPDAVEPDAVEPDAVEPDAVEPDAVEPDAVEPDAVEPDAVEPDAVEPDAVEPDAVEPDAVEPDAVEPDAVEPDAVEPDAVEPDAVEPDAVEPDAVEPDAVEPDAVEPDAVEPDAVEPDAVEPDAVEPDAVSLDTAETEPAGPKPVDTSPRPTRKAVAKGTTPRTTRGRRTARNPAREPSVTESPPLESTADDATDFQTTE